MIKQPGSKDERCSAVLQCRFSRDWLVLIDLDKGRFQSARLWNSEAHKRSQYLVDDFPLRDAGDKRIRRHCKDAVEPVAQATSNSMIDPEIGVTRIRLGPCCGGRDRWGKMLRRGRSR